MAYPLPPPHLLVELPLKKYFFAASLRNVCETINWEGLFRSLIKKNKKLTSLPFSSIMLQSSVKLISLRAIKRTLSGLGGGAILTPPPPDNFGKISSKNYKIQWLKSFCILLNMYLLWLQRKHCHLQPYRRAERGDKSAVKSSDLKREITINIRIFSFFFFLFHFLASLCVVRYNLIKGLICNICSLSMEWYYCS